MKSLILAAAIAVNAIALPSAESAPLPNAPTAVARDHLSTALYGKRGPVVVLIPGMSTPGAMWGDIVSDLARDHRVLVAEVNGFDGARAPANERDGLIDGIVADLAADLAARKLARPVLVGHSFGGLVAMKFALAQPETPRSLVIVDALPFFGTVFGDGATVESMRARARQMHDMMIAQADAIRAAATKGVAKDPGGTMSVDPDHRRKVAEWSLRADPAVVAQALLEDFGTDLRTDIAAIRAPITVLYQAEEDPAASAKRYATDYAAYPKARLVPVAKTGHFIPLDRPDAVLAAIHSASR